MMRLSPNQVELMNGATVPVELDPFVDQVLTQRGIDHSRYQDEFEVLTQRYGIAKELGMLFGAISEVTVVEAVK